MTTLFGKNDNTDQPPQLQLTPPRVICGKHGEPFKAQWPEGYPMFVSMGLEGLKACTQWRSQVEDSVASIEAALDKVPLCCVLYRAGLLLDIFYEINNQHFKTNHAYLWPFSRCVNCDKVQAAYGVGMPGLPAAGAHICLVCCARNPQPNR